MFPALAFGQDALTLRMPSGLIAQGFDKHLLPRFKFKHRISVTAVDKGEADMALGAGVSGQRVFSDQDGLDYGLAIETEEAHRRNGAETFREWLASAPGQAAIEGFAPNGEQMFTTDVTIVEVEDEEVFDGDSAKGARLALVHCGRCHVVDDRNRMGGIGSTPSFAALRGRENWSDLFRAFYAENPHPSFTQVEGVTEPFDPNRQVHVAPMEITLDEVEAITAFVSTISPKDLGRPVQSN